MKKLKDYLFSNKKTFAKGICKEKLFFIFVFGCIFGCVYEEALEMFVQYTNTGTFQWVTRRGLIYGELSPVYGIGAVALVFLLARKERAWYKNYLYGSLIGGGFEYILSLVQEKFTGTVSWDYTGYLLNLNGRTTVPFMLFWGILSLMMVYIFYPILSNLIEKIPYNLGMIIYYVLLVLISIDIIISFSAAVRQAIRRLGVKPISPVGEFIDKIYTDERLARAYTNAIVK
ncbi:MAG: putative ABC transporter permease [Bacilli bacterium]|nr:putative ABC transporter permease [Bacilli bacterium]